MRYLLLLLCSLSVLAQAQSVSELRSGVIYQPGTRLAIASLGLSFEVPAGFRAALPANSEVLLMETEDQTGRMLVSVSSGGSVEQIEASLTQPYPIDEFTQLVPATAPKRSGDQWLQSYKVEGLADPNAKAVAMVRLGSNQLVMLVLLIYTDYETQAVSAAQQLISSAQFSKPQLAAPSVSDNPNLVTDLDWNQRLRGGALRYLKTSNGYSASRYYYLCSNNQFVYSDNDSYLSSDASSDFSYSGNANNHGQWSIEGNRLSLMWANGNQNQFSLSRRYVQEWDEWGTFLDNTRWFEVRNSVCQ